MSFQPDDALSKLHDQVIRARADIHHIAKALASPISDADRLKCIKRAERASERLDQALNTLSMNPASLLGSIGGKKTAERGPDYFRQIAAMRKTRAGGRPRKNPEHPASEVEK
jgi:hypothetical protein